MLLITGATGNIGGSVGERLHAEGHDVRALVRSASRAELLPDGIDIAVGDLDDGDAVAAALDGVDGVYGPSEVVEHWPVFAGEVDALKTTDIDANASDPAWTERRTL